MKENIQFCCKRCGHRLFDYVDGNLKLRLKCNKCKRTLWARSSAYEVPIKMLRIIKLKA